MSQSRTHSSYRGTYAGHVAYRVSRRPAPEGSGSEGIRLQHLGFILGTGIFVGFGVATEVAGPGVLLAIALAAMVAACNGLSTAQLATHSNTTGRDEGTGAFPPSLAFVGGWMLVCAKTAAAATAALGRRHHRHCRRGARRSRAPCARRIVRCSNRRHGLGGPVRPRKLDRGWSRSSLACHSGHAGCLCRTGEECGGEHGHRPSGKCRRAAGDNRHNGLSRRWSSRARHPRPGGARPSHRGDRGSPVRLLFDLARMLDVLGPRGNPTDVFGPADPQQRMPAPAVALSVLAVAGLVLTRDVRVTWSLSAFTLLMYYAIANLAAARLPDGWRRLPRGVALTVLGACLLLAFSLEPAIWQAGLGLLGMGIGWPGASRDGHRLAMAHHPQGAHGPPAPTPRRRVASGRRHR
jgi:hypothetical protein